MKILTLNEVDERYKQDPDANEWTALIPAAGRGSRLGYSKPKILFPVAGRPILDWIIDRLEARCKTFIFILSPQGVASVEPYLERRLKGKYQIVIQNEPKGMADAISLGIPLISTPYTFIIWGDQAAIQQDTIDRTMRIQQYSHSTEFSFPLVSRNDPYVHYERDHSGLLRSIYERREGKKMPAIGESDCGVFAFRSSRLKEVFSSMQSKGILYSPVTKEWNFLPMLPLFESGNESVLSFRLEGIEETVGVNDNADATLLEFYPLMTSMKESNAHLKVVMFSGGRGTGALTEALLKYPDIELTLLVNTYDDGLSTGLLRRFIPGMLGPSDVRKNISRFLKVRTDTASQALHELIEYRLPDGTGTNEALLLLRSFVSLEHNELTHELLVLREKLALIQAKKASRYLEAFLRYYEQRIVSFPEFTFSDCSFGNLLFAGCYLASGEDFNEAITNFSLFAEVGDRVLNITNGDNRVLVAMKENGKYLYDEASIVGPQDNSRIQEIFLLPEYLDQAKYPLGRFKIDNIRLLRNVESLPDINPVAEKMLREADIIIYGPGTQYSSLLPSYLTSGIAEAIQENTRAEKIFIANIARDYDILGEDATTLVRAFLFNMSRKVDGAVKCQDVVTRFFFQKPEANASGETPYVPFDAKAFEYPLEKVVWIDWEGEKGKHSGSKTISELLLLVEGALQKKVAHIAQKVSIIVPALNEERTVKSVLHGLMRFHFPGTALEKEIIFVDGGSSDKTYEIASAESGVRVYRTSGGRGKALRLGLEKAKGDIVVFFPSDAEYLISDIARVVQPLVNQEFPVVFGSRAFRTNDLNGTLKRIYGEKGFLYLISKYGGALLSILTLVIYHRFVGDPLTSLKGFNARIFRDLQFTRNGVDFDMELIAKIARKKYVILEVPVSYKARTIKEGKKITVLDGIKCLWTLLKYSVWKEKSLKVEYAKSINRYSSV